MKKIFLTSILIMLFGNILYAVQDYNYVVETNTASDTLRYYEDRLKLYEIDKFGSNTALFPGTTGAEKLTAASLSLIFPSFGHTYAGDTQRGLIFLLVEALEMALFTFLANSNNIQSNSNSYNAGIGLFFITKLWEATDAMNTIDDENAKLRQQLGIDY